MPRPNFITENAKMKKMGFSLQTGGVHSNLWPKIHPKATSFQQNYLVLTNVRRGCVKKQSLDVTNRFSSCIWLVEPIWMLKQCKLLSSSTATRFFDYTGKFIDNQWGSIRHKATQWREKQTGIHMYIMCILRTYIYFIYICIIIYTVVDDSKNLQTSKPWWFIGFFRRKWKPNYWGIRKTLGHRYTCAFFLHSLCVSI